MIWECPIVQRFLEQLHSLCLSKDFELNSSDETFIFGESNKNEVSELFYIMLMLIKQYFYKARCQNTVPKLVMLITAKQGVPIGFSKTLFVVQICRYSTVFLKYLTHYP